MRSILKQLIFIIAEVITFPLVALYRIARSQDLFVGQGQLLALVPGKFGSYLRIAFYNKTLQSCPKNGYIGFGTYFSHPEVELGPAYYIGAYCVIGMARIGAHATIASGVHILSGKHQHGFKEINKPIQEQRGEFIQISIGKNCWIGSGAIVMANLGIQNVIAAGSVVTVMSCDYQMLAGNPARVVQRIAN